MRESDTMMSHDQRSDITRRSFLATTASSVAATSMLAVIHDASAAKPKKAGPAVRTVLGPVAPEKFGVTLMHEHAPIVDWSELFETKPAPIEPVREKLIAHTAKLLDAFQATLSKEDGRGAVVETTPIRVGRYPQLLVDLAKRTKVHLIASSGFWCEGLAPQHPWAVRLGIEKDGIKRMTELFVREVTTGMEDPRAKWGEKFTDIKAGILKIGTSTYLRPSERAIHIAAAHASKETGCPITTHTTDGGGLEEAELLLKSGAKPERIIIGHQGHLDDRKNEEAHEYHRLIANLGCYVQFDRVDHKNYEIDKQARQIKYLLDRGFAKQVLVSHDHSPYYYPEFTAAKKTGDGWKKLEPDYGTVTTKLVPALKNLDVSAADIRTILIENPRRVLAF
jgi:phosphotriesterase-related protein